MKTNHTSGDGDREGDEEEEEEVEEGMLSSWVNKHTSTLCSQAPANSLYQVLQVPK